MRAFITVIVAALVLVALLAMAYGVWQDCQRQYVLCRIHCSVGGNQASCLRDCQDRFTIRNLPAR
jgi:hypothetical protein